MKYLFFVILISQFLFLTMSCSQTKTIQQNEKEIELLKRELELTKKENEITKKGIQKNIPSDFFKIINISSPIQQITDMFGYPKKIELYEEDNYYRYYYELNNAYLLIESTDNVTIMSISIESKNIEPYIEIGLECPIKFDNEKQVLLGKSKFKELQIESEIEISRDRCNSLGFIVDFGAGPCKYNYFIYGNRIDYETFEVDYSKFINGEKFFESSYGKMNFEDFSDQIINYIVLTPDFDILKNYHIYGQGIHCDIINR